MAWAQVAVIAILFSAVFWHNLVRLWFKTNPFTGEANWSHSICVPIIGLYYLFVRREELLKIGAEQFVWDRVYRSGRLVASVCMIAAAAVMVLVSKDRPAIAFTLIYAMGAATGVLGVLVLLLDWSLGTTLFGLGLFCYGIYPGQNDYLKDVGMVITLFGIVLMMTGRNVMQIAWFPILFLICAIPWPGLVYSWIAEPLQTMAAHVAVDVLKISGVDSICSGTKIVIFSNGMQPPRVLNVAEACAGMRSLMTFVAVGGAIAFLPVRPLWQKIIIVISSVPIAIFCNVMRISGQGLLDHYVSPQWSESFAHQFVGMIMLIPAFFLILGVAHLMDKLFIEEAEEGEAGYPAKAPEVAAIQTRQTVIPALGTMSSAPVAPMVAVKPVSPRPPVTQRPASPAVAGAGGVRPPVTTIPPRPITPANPRPRAAPVRTPMSSSGPRTPVSPAQRRPVDLGAANRPPAAPTPANGRSTVKPADTKPREIP